MLPRYNRFVLRPLLACAFCLAWNLFGADFTGIWTGQLADRNGELHDLSFQFTPKGDVLAGKMYGDNESTAIAEGKISGDQITFSITNEMNGQITKFVYTGTVHGADLEMTRERIASKTPAPADASKKPDPKQTFTLKRVV